MISLSLVNRNIYLADTEGQRSVLPPSGNMHFSHAAFSGSARACRPVCARVLLSPQRIHRHLQTVSRKSAVSPPVERERAAAGDDSLHKNQLGRQCCSAWQGRAAQGVRVNKSEWRLKAAFTQPTSMCFYFFKKKVQKLREYPFLQGPERYTTGCQKYY